LNEGFMDRRDAAVAAIMAVVYAAVAGLFFLLADQVIRAGGALSCWALSVK